MVTLGRWSQALEGVVYRVLKKPIVCFILFTLGGLNFQMIVLACDHLKGEKASKKALKKACGPSWNLGCYGNFITDIHQDHFSVLIALSTPLGCLGSLARFGIASGSFGLPLAVPHTHS
jgi:hypothetical protein